MELSSHTVNSWEHDSLNYPITYCISIYSGSLHTTDRVSASAIMTEIQKSIENWEEKDINKQCYDFVLGMLLGTDAE